MLSKRYEWTGRLLNLATCAIGDSLVHQQWHSQVVEIQKETSTEIYMTYQILTYGPFRSEKYQY